MLAEGGTALSSVNHISQSDLTKDKEIGQGSLDIATRDAAHPSRQPQVAGEGADWLC